MNRSEQRFCMKACKTACNASSECIWTVQRQQLREKLTRKGFYPRRYRGGCDHLCKAFRLYLNDDGYAQKFYRDHRKERKSRREIQYAACREKELSRELIDEGI